MPKTRPPYSPEFRRQMVELVRAGRDPADLAREFEPSPLGDPTAKQRPAELAEGAQAIRNWVSQADRQEGRPCQLRRPPAACRRCRHPAGGLRGIARDGFRVHERERRTERFAGNREVRREPRGSPDQAAFPIGVMARVLGVSEAGCHAWLRRPPSAHAQADAVLLRQVRTVHASSRETYGAPRVHAELRVRGERHSRKRIARPSLWRSVCEAAVGGADRGREAGLVGASRRRGGPATTRRDKEARPAPDPLSRDFSATGPNQLGRSAASPWVADITFIPTAAGFLSRAVVLDAWSRRIVGWAMANHLRAASRLRRTGVLDAWERAVGQRRPRDVIHRSDQGSPYTSPAFAKRCKEAGARPSIGSVGDAYDDAMCESFSATLECELLERRRFASQVEARMACFSFIEG